MQDNLSEDDISVKFITPAIVKVGWDEAAQIRRQVEALIHEAVEPGDQAKGSAPATEAATTV